MIRLIQKVKNNSKNSIKINSKFVRLTPPLLQAVLSMLLLSTVWKFKDFLSSVRFYVKSILDNLEVLNLPFFGNFRGSEVFFLRKTRFFSWLPNQVFCLCTFKSLCRNYLSQYFSLYFSICFFLNFYLFFFRFGHFGFLLELFTMELFYLQPNYLILIMMFVYQMDNLQLKELLNQNAQFTFVSKYRLFTKKNLCTSLDLRTSSELYQTKKFSTLTSVLHSFKSLPSFD